MNEQQRRAAVRRVIARGSTPEAIEEAEGDFGPGGTFAEVAPYPSSAMSPDLAHRIQTSDPV